MIQYKLIQQGALPWRDVIIGTGIDGKGNKYPMPISGFGCDLSTVASILWAFQKDTDPEKLFHDLAAVGGMTADGNIDNVMITKVYPDVFFFAENYITTTVTGPGEGRTEITAAIEMIYRMIDMGIPVAITVDAAPGDGQHAATHFVEVVDKNNGDPLIMDPIYGKIMPLSANYGKPEDAIFGVRIFFGCPVTVPDGGDLERGVATWKTATVIDAINKGNYSLAKQYAKEALLGLTS